MLQRAATNAYSWWWASHIRTKQSKWLDQSLQDMEEKVGNMLSLIQEDGDSFARRAEMYYKKRPELINFVEESYRAFRALAERYDKLSTELQNANTTIASMFPDQVPFEMDEDDEYGGPPRMPKNFPQAPAPNAPKIPKFPKAQTKDLKGLLTTASKKLQSKKKSKPENCNPAVQKSGLSKDEALVEIDKLQKEMLALQTVKEFVKSSYESGLEKYWGIDNQVMEMQQKVCSLQDEFAVASVIEDDEARTLMAEAALKSCQETLAQLQERQDKSTQDAKTEYERIEDARQKLESLKHEFLPNQIDEGKLEKDVSEKAGRKSESLKEVKKELGLDERDSKKSFTVTELAEKIDQLVNKVISLESSVSSQTALIDRLRTETDDLQAQIRTLEEDKATLIDGTQNLKNRLKEMEAKLQGLQNLNQNVENQNTNLQTHFTEARSSLDHLSKKLQSVKPEEEIEVTGSSREQEGVHVVAKAPQEEKQKDIIPCPDNDLRLSKILETEKVDDKKEKDVKTSSGEELRKVSDKSEKCEVLMPKDEAKKQDLSRKEDEAKKQDLSRKEDEAKKQHLSRKEDEAKKQDLSRKEDEAKKQDLSQKEDEAKKQDLSQKEDEAKKQDMSQKEDEAKKQDPSRKEDEAKKQDPSLKEGEAKKQDPSLKEDEAKKQDLSRTEDEAKKQDLSRTEDGAKKEDLSRTEDEAKKQDLSRTEDGAKKEDLSRTEESLLKTEPKEGETDVEEEMNWQQMLLSGEENREKILLKEYTTILRNYKDVKKKLSDVENQDQGSIVQLTAQVNNLRNAIAKRDQEIHSLRQKLYLLQGSVRKNQEFNLDDWQVPSEEGDEDDEKVIMVGEPQSVSVIEEKLRMDIDAILDENLDFWLRFSTAFHQVQKFRTEVDDLQAEIAQLKQKKKKESDGKSNTSMFTTDIKSDVRPIYKHLREIQTELTVWLEQSVKLKEELQRRLSSLGNIQQEITMALREGVEEEEIRFTSHQAAKFQGEILNMQQENNKVNEELQAGLDHVSALQLETEKTLAKLEEEFGLKESNNQSQGQLGHSPSRNRIPLRSFIFGVKPKKQKQSIFACMHHHRKFDSKSVLSL